MGSVFLMLYLDNAATTLRKPAAVYTSMMWNTVFKSVNAGRGGHKMSMYGMNGIIEAQDEIAELFNIYKPQNIAFTLNATYALNMVMIGVLLHGGHVIVTEMDHNSVLRPAYRLGNYTIVKADESGYVEPKDVQEAIREDTKLIVCTHASNVCGTIQPVEEIGKIAHENNILYMIDAAQTAGCIEIDVQKLRADFLAFSGHKGLMGPLGTGGVYVRDPMTLEPVITGGTGSKSESLIQPMFMPDMLHSGTLNSPAIAALGKGVRYIKQRGLDEISQKERYLALKMESELLNMGGITVYGRKDRVGTTAFNIDGMSSSETAQKLSDKFALRAGYHCAPLAHKALKTIKTGVVRASFGAFNKNKDVEKVVDAIWKLKNKG
jgi:cysteine desulfurase/selenocysteine lyase